MTKKKTECCGSIGKITGYIFVETFKNGKIKKSKPVHFIKIDNNRKKSSKK